LLNKDEISDLAIVLRDDDVATIYVESEAI